jgi:predicted glycosyltransferase
MGSRMSKIRTLGLVAVLTAASLTASAQAAAHHTAPAPAMTAKHVACEKVWRAQKVRHGSREAFITACVTKG